MSNPRYWWYGIVLRVIARFPELARAIEAKETQRITPAYGHRGGGSRSTGRKTERTAIRTVTAREYEDYRAVKAALEIVEGWEDGAYVSQVVRLHSWQHMTFDETADKLHLSERTCRRLFKRFVYLVAAGMGYVKA